MKQTLSRDVDHSCVFPSVVAQHSFEDALILS